MTKPRIGVFEDRDPNYEVIEKALKRELGDHFAVERYDGKRPLGDAHDAKRWVREFLLSPEPAIVTLIDWDLGEFAHAAEQPFVRGVAEDISIPIVMYQSEEPKEQKLARLNRWQERRIALDSNTDGESVATVCADAARGFVLILEKVSATKKGPRLLDTLKEILAPPSDSALHLEQFAVGNQELLKIVKQQPGPEQYRFISTWMGYLIHNRILQFPGPVLNRTAAAAYLGVDASELDDADLQALISTAVYKGPFAKTQGGWWRTELDAVIGKHISDEDASVPLGRIALGRALGRKLKPGRCREKHDFEEPGFVCVISGDPVCFRHSESPEAWVPQGADRCRIHTYEFELMQGWLGM